MYGPQKQLVSLHSILTHLETMIACLYNFAPLIKIHFCCKLFLYVKLINKYWFQTTDQQTPNFTWACEHDCIIVITFSEDTCTDRDNLYMYEGVRRTLVMVTLTRQEQQLQWQTTETYMYMYPHKHGKDNRFSGMGYIRFWISNYISAYLSGVITFPCHVSLRPTLEFSNTGWWFGLLPPIRMSLIGKMFISNNSMFTEV